MVNEKPHNNVVAEAVGVGRIVAVGFEFSGLPVESVQSVAVRSDPKVGGTVLNNRDHVGIGYRASRPVGGNFPGLWIATDERFWRAHPKNTLSILE